MQDRQPVNNGRIINQTWTPKKIICYLLYRLLAKHIPGDIGYLRKFSYGLRRMLCRPLLSESGEIFGIGPGVDFGTGENLIMRNCANLGPWCHIGGHGRVTIGQHVMMGYHCIILTQNHMYLAEGYDGMDIKDVLIDDYAWLGHRVIVLPGIRIGKHAIVGAGSVVTKDVPDYAVAAGNPAIVRKMRK
jgi:maltose O-acetyltransferase